MVDYHNKWFKPNNASLIIVGDISMGEIKPRLEKYFKNWSSAEIPQKNINPVEVAENEVIYLIDRPGAQQSIVLAANIAPSPSDSDELAIESMNDIIGG